MDVRDALTLVADDVIEQARQAHLEQKPAVSEALYGVGNAMKRTAASENIARPSRWTRLKLALEFRERHGRWPAQGDES